MQSEIDVLVHALFQEKERAKKEAENARHSKYTWVVSIIAAFFFGGFWFSGYQAKKYYNLGLKEGIMSTEGRGNELEVESAVHLECDNYGHNCVNKLNIVPAK